VFVLILSSKEVAKKTTVTPSGFFMKEKPTYITILELQLAEAAKRERLPEIKLWTTCLIEGVKEFLKGPGTREFQYAKSWLREAYWVLCDKDETVPGSFNWICLSIGTEPSYIRRKVLEAYPRRRRWG